MNVKTAVLIGFITGDITRYRISISRYILFSHITVNQNKNIERLNLTKTMFSGKPRNYLQ